MPNIWRATRGVAVEVMVRFEDQGRGVFSATAKSGGQVVAPTSTQTTNSDATWTYPAFDKTLQVTIGADLQTAPGATAQLVVKCSQSGAVLPCQATAAGQIINGPAAGPWREVPEADVAVNTTHVFSLSVREKV